ncbi:hypothetical protein I3843_03G117700 [Carya illinoinensis]|uniref:Flavin-containing monooxygenase n=1 Tax=Carya illinoinensis TaxID=32201 RepID=A0A922JVA8_CARIL|nr:hypothetical protein I3842_03G118200 [Carya illinoinensis]KAG7987141.1 hypothetical protein I3843_03G117700 [Carya illinoinensis]
METVAVIVGAGPSGLAISACLTLHSIPFIILEREDCYASLWKKRTYDRLSLHLAKEFCYLPFAKHPRKAKTYISKDAFLRYIDDYVSHFKITPRYHRSVESAELDKVQGKWRIEAHNTIDEKIEVYFASFLVVASGENSEGYIPDIPGLDGFPGEVVHSSHYKSGLKYENKDVLVVGCGNSGMEIAYDLSNYHARTSIVVRSPFHVLTKGMVHLGMSLLKWFSVDAVDKVTLLLARFTYGNLSKYGIHQPKLGPFFQKVLTGRSPVIDVGTVKKIKSGEIKVLPGISRINGNNVVFDDSKEMKFDAIVFATGYKSTVTRWLKDYKYVMNEDGMPSKSFPSHWKGENGLHCAGFSRRGLAGITTDAIAIADDINKVYTSKK